MQHALQLLELGRDVTAACRSGEREAPSLVLLHLRVDHPLHLGGTPHRGETLLPVLPARLDDQVAGAEQPLDDALAEVHGVDPFEGDLDATLGDDAGAEDQPVGRDHEVCRRPLQVPHDEPDHRADEEPQRHRRQRRAFQVPTSVDVRVRMPTTIPTTSARTGFGVVPPVRVHVDGHVFVRVQQPLRIRHGLTVLRPTMPTWTPTR